MIYKSILKQTCNTRELGGFMTPVGQTVYNRIWRSDRLCVYDADDERLLIDRDMTTLIDMRTDEEAERYPCAYAGRDGFDYHHCAITEGSTPPASLEEVPASYMSIALSDGMRNALRTVSEAEAGIVFFCTAGKDRTGVASAVILSLCGVTRQDIIDDYVLSREYNRERLEAFLAEHPGIDRSIVLANEKSMDGFLDLLYKKYGSTDGYLDSLGLSECREGIRIKMYGK
ncbi:MAG: tyrosine-protein phosphatase [Oscillospiraceae bacterium]|nr:tyrosine-protein phosphatase [Oscillospiraceae bacterium]